MLCANKTLQKLVRIRKHKAATAIQAAVRTAKLARRHKEVSFSVCMCLSVCVLVCERRSIRYVSVCVDGGIKRCILVYVFLCYVMCMHLL
jgi:hypothetical protein